MHRYPIPGPAGPQALRVRVSVGAQNSDPATSALLSLQALPLAGVRPPPALKSPGLALPGLDGDIAWANPGFGNSFSVGLGATELEARKRTQPPVQEPGLSEPACSRPSVGPAPFRVCRGPDRGGGHGAEDLTFVVRGEGPL